MHQLNQHPVEAIDMDASQDGLDGSLEEIYFCNDNDQFLQTDISDVDNCGEHIDSQRKQTLFNLRLTSLGKRLSEFESENEEPDFTISRKQKPRIKGGKKSRKGSHEHVAETKPFEFVPHKATKFARGESRTEIFLEKVPDLGYTDEEGSEDVASASGSDGESMVMCPPSDAIIKVSDIQSECDPKQQDAVVMFTVGLSGHFLHKNKLTDKKQNKTDESSTLEEPSNLPSLTHSVDSSPARTNFCESDRSQSVLPSLTRMEPDETSLKESGFVKSSGKTDETSLKESGFVKSSGKTEETSLKESGFVKSSGKTDETSLKESGFVRSSGKTDEISLKESGFVRSSGKTDSGFISASESHDEVEVCTKNSNSSPSSVTAPSVTAPSVTAPSVTAPSVTAPSVTADDEDKRKLKQRFEEQTLQAGSAFTEFVNIESFGASPQNKNLHTEAGSPAKNEKQLEVLLKSGSTKALKSYLRNSQWPAESGVRLHLWEHLCNHLLQAEEHLFQKLVDDMLSDDEESWMLPSFVEPDTTHSYFLTACGKDHAKTVVNLISHLHPDITYCPVLYPMTSLFLHYMTPQASFNCMQALLRSRQSCYFTQTKIKTEASKYVLRDLAKKYGKQAYDLMLHSGTSVEAVFGNWMWWIFRDLPFQYLVRIIDSFLLEGHKIFYRISLAIVILFAKRYNRHGQQNSAAADVSADISRFCADMSIDPRKLIQVAFGIRGLSRREISRLHEKNEVYLMSLPASSFSTKRLNILRLKEPVPSAILTPEMLQNIWQWIPDKLSLMKPKLIFSSNEHGTAIRTFYAQIEHSSHTILAVKTTNNEIFGAVCSSPWYTRHEKNKPKTSFFGTGETFVFSISPVLERYLWCPEYSLELFMAGDDHMLMIGSGNGTAIYLDQMLNRGSSTSCDTFHNVPLCSTSDFSCQVVEVFSFTE